MTDYKMEDSPGGAPLDRREFLRRLAAGTAGALALAALPGTVHAAQASPSPGTGLAAAPAATGAYDVALLRSTDRAAGTATVLGMLGFAPGWLRGRHVVLKANFNSADPPPGSTSLTTLRALLAQLQNWGAAGITLVERSGMGVTRDVLASRGVLALARTMGVDVVVLDDLPAGGWVRITGTHWARGFLFPRVVLEAGAVVQTCCLKTHRFGGHFSMALKNSVGLAAKYDPRDGYNYMRELHASPAQRQMIAELNAAYRPAFVLLDGVAAFVNGGPDRGQTATPGLLLAGRDRVAIDAVGVAMLRQLGTTAEVSHGPIFGQAQLAHAVALGLGAPSARAVAIRPAGDAASTALAAQLARQLAA